MADENEKSLITEKRRGGSEGKGRRERELTFKTGRITDDMKLAFLALFLMSDTLSP